MVGDIRTWVVEVGCVVAAVGVHVVEVGRGADMGVEELEVGEG